MKTTFVLLIIALAVFAMAFTLQPPLLCACTSEIGWPNIGETPPACGGGATTRSVTDSLQCDSTCDVSGSLMGVMCTASATVDACVYILPSSNTGCTGVPVQRGINGAFSGTLQNCFIGQFNCNTPNNSTAFVRVLFETTWTSPPDLCSGVTNATWQKTFTCVPD